MPSLTSGRYAAVTSTLALVVALGGTSYAAATIGTGNLKNNAVISTKIKNGSVVGADLENGTVTGLDVATNSLTGADVQESSLGRVRNADTALRAGDAGTVDGITVKTVNAVQDTGPGRPFFVYSSAGLDVELRCFDPGTGLHVGLLATSSRSGSRIATVVLSDELGAAPVENDVENGNFGPSVGEFDLLAGDDGDTAQLTFTYADPSGAVVQGTLSTDVTSSNAEPCSVSGVVTAR